MLVQLEVCILERESASALGSLVIIYRYVERWLGFPAFGT